MIKTLKNLFYPILALLVIGFVLFLFNQVSSIYLAANQISPTLGWVVLSGLTLMIGTLLLIPLYQYLRLPTVPSQPKVPSEIEPFQKKVLKRLQNNQHLQSIGQVPTKTDELEASIAALDKEADKVINETARLIFLTTAISQNGKLDTLTVLGAQMRMVWQVSQIYYQRPSLREMGKVYGFVGASSFLAGEIEDMDITRQIEPVASALFKNASGKSLPLIGPAATLIMDSLLEGSTNAYLSLRVGILTKKYCGNLVVLDKKTAKNQALVEAAKQLKVVSIQASARVITGMLNATKNAGLDTLRSGWEGLKKTGQKVSHEVTNASPFKRKKESTKED